MSVANRSVLRALRMLDLLADSTDPVPLARLADELEVPRSTAHSILTALVEAQYAEAVPGGHRVGIRAFETGSSYARHLDLATAAEPELRRLTDRLGVTAHFAVLDADTVVYIAKHDPPRTGVQLASSVGARLSALRTAVGKAQLASLPPSSIDRSLARDDTQLRELAPEFDAIRGRGFAVDDGHTASGVRCVAAPVFSRDGCVGAIGVSTWLEPDSDVEALGRAVMDAAAAASERLGGRSRGRS
ncbi:IclR family transcriptional regulator [Microlunatus soli]|uniref:DNA-binding transcriptional regulator, IclR family n=1 Tax=Microlunatus soli TaxID=630515 RepID=A0A1H1RTS9_9ACTN|nr:IclR family transcriptional regulator [Microlunatus soli]SDS39094.1 DNA-binding transcriptional regulator, IclR family [Microlunatus soli]